MTLSAAQMESINQICQRLMDNKPVRRSLPFDGRLHMDRQLPFLCIGRMESNSENSRKIVNLVKTQPSYLLYHHRNSGYAKVLIGRIAELFSAKFSSCIVLEITDSSPDREPESIHVMEPTLFKDRLLPSCDTLGREIKRIKVQDKFLKFNREADSQYFRKRSYLPKRTVCEKYQCHCLSVAIPSALFFLDGVFLPLVYKRFQRRWSNVLQKAFFTFCTGNTSFKPITYSSLGRRSFVKAVLETDRQLFEIDKAVDLLLLVSPVNTYAAWRMFKKNHYAKSPEFLYNPASFDPMILKQKLYKVPIGKIEDPTLAYIFRNKQMELDRQISMVVDRNSDNFHLGSLQVYGRPDKELLELSEALLARKKSKKTPRNEKQYLSPVELSAAAQKELDYYKLSCPDLKAGIEIRSDISGVMVSQNKLLISATSKVSEFRLGGLLNHEVGVHLLTYFNGQNTPLKLFSCGLDGYEEMQEGLAIFAEFITEKLNKQRLNLLAARVLGVNSFLEGHSFIDSFELICSKGFSEELAFNVVARIYRSGGFTKDYIYLNGFLKVLWYLKSGGKLENLFLGKYSFDHIPLILELRDRKIIQFPLLIPRFLKDNDADSFLQGLQAVDSIKNMLLEEGD